jgi:molybdate transport system substrate-binding protein
MPERRFIRDDLVVVRYFPLFALLSLVLSTPVLGRSELKVAAAISLMPLLEDVLPAYRSHSGLGVSVTYGASGTLSRQLFQGAPIDIFLSGAPEHIDALEKAGHTVSGTRVEIARGAMVLVTPSGKNLIKGFSDLALPAVKRVAIGNPKTVPAGAYGMEILTHLGLMPGLGPRLIHAGHARQALSYVESGDADAGIVYKSDAINSSKVQIAATADPVWSRPVRYEAVILRRTMDLNAAETLLHFLGGSVVRSAVATRGFSSPGGKP